MSKKHVLFLSPGFPANEADTQCIPALQVFAKAMGLQKEVKISVICLHYPQQHGQRKWFGMDIYDAYGTNKISIFINAWKWIQSIHKGQSIDIIHSFWLTDAAFLGHWIGRLKGINHCITLMGQDVRPSNFYLRFFPLKRLNLIALSSFHAAVYHQTTGHTVQNIIPWGLASKDVNITPEKRAIDILGVGNLIPLKAYDQFIRVIKAISKQCATPLRVAIIGKGPEEKRLKQLAKDLGVENNIHFYGNIDRHQVLALMQQSKVLLHPSSYESFGLVFLEALANGACVVSKKVGIAQAGERWLLAETVEDMTAQCFRALEIGKKYKPLNLYPIQETVAQYLQLIFSNA